MKYISLFSGIGGFELAIRNVFPDAKCIGFSEIDKFALKVYKQHFQDHLSLGDITLITEQDIKELIEREGACDLLVGGFPCQNLSSLARYSEHCDSNGLNGAKSGLFWMMLRIIGWVHQYNKNRVLHFVIENNASMKKEYKKQITDELQNLYVIPIHCTMLDGADFGVQRRKRLYWTTFCISTNEIKCTQTWDDVLLPIEKVQELKCTIGLLNNYNKVIVSRPSSCILTWNGIDIVRDTKIKYCSRWQLSYHSDTSNNKATPFTRRKPNNILIDRRKGNVPRHFHVTEAERLFRIPDGWVGDSISLNQSYFLLGNTVIIKVIEFILNQFH